MCCVCNNSINNMIYYGEKWWEEEYVSVANMKVESRWAGVTLCVIISINQ